MIIPPVPQAVLIDLAGVLYNDDQPVPGAVDALVALRASGLALRFLTNTTRSPRQHIVAKLGRMGFAVAAEEIQTAVLATRSLVEQRKLRPHYLVHSDIQAEIGRSHADPDAVVVGDAGREFTYEALNGVFRLLMRGLPFIAMARNRYFMEHDDLSLDLGGFIAGLEFSSGRSAEVVGKPAGHFFHSALAALGVDPGRAVLIGDDLSDDIGGAQSAGIAGILVRTGKFQASDEVHPQFRPAIIVDDFPAAVAALCAAINNGQDSSR